MKLLQVTIETTSEAMEAVGGALMMLGHEEMEWLDDAATLQRFLDETALMWDYTDASVLANQTAALRLTLTDDEPGHAALSAIRTRMSELGQEDFGLTWGTLRVSVVSVDDADWANTWKQYFRPFMVGRTWCVCPEWEQIPPEAGTRRVLRLNPGLVFGTGQHETTMLCLTLLEDLPLQNRRVLDAGAGSGILSIAALLGGAACALGVDIDPNAEKIMKENANLCGQGEKLNTLTANMLTDDPKTFGDGYDILLANIVADVILPLIPKAAHWLAPGGSMILSGILKERLHEIERMLLENGYTVQTTQACGDWAAVLARRSQEED